MLTGAGFLMAVDSETPGAANMLGGILQSSTYLAGVSGGAWAVVWQIVNDHSPIFQSLYQDADLSEQLMAGIPEIDPSLEKDLLHQPVSITNNFATALGALLGSEPPNDDRSTFKVSNNLDSKLKTLGKIFRFYHRIHDEVKAKKSGGWYTSFTDYWARALCQRLFSKSAKCIGSLSSTTKRDTFVKHLHPYPLINAIQKQPNRESSDYKSSHTFEISPFEFGSWESYLNAFVQIKYLGSNITAGRPSVCANGYDNICFLTAVSSSLFNEVSLVVFKLLVSTKSEASKAIETLLSVFGVSRTSAEILSPSSYSDHAIISPNPFFEWPSASNSIRNSPHLYLVDGGDDGQNVPFHSLLQPCRQVDIIFAVDGSSDVGGYPNGTTLIHTSKRHHNPEPEIAQPAYQITDNSGTTHVKSYFPYVPSAEEAKQKKLMQKPIFLGCDIMHDYPDLNHNRTVIASENGLPPLIVYFANRQVVHPANTSTFKLSYNETEKKQLMENAYELATHENSTEFAHCVKCAILKRTFDRQMLQHPQYHVPRICHQCFSQYCWRKIHR